MAHVTEKFVGVVLLALGTGRSELINTVRNLLISLSLLCFFPRQLDTWVDSSYAGAEKSQNLLVMLHPLSNLRGKSLSVNPRPASHCDSHRPLLNLSVSGPQLYWSPRVETTVYLLCRKRGQTTDVQSSVIQLSIKKHSRNNLKKFFFHVDHF